MKIIDFFRLGVLWIAFCVVATSFAHGFIVVGPQHQIVDVELSYRPGYETEFDHAVDLGNLPPGGRIIAAHDFDRNGSTDLVLEYDPDGVGPRRAGTFLWLFNGAVRISVHQLGGVPSGFSVPFGCADRDKNGSFEYYMSYPDRLLVKGIEISATAPFTATAKPITGGPSRTFSSVVGIGDLNEDHEQDLILQNPTTKELCYRFFRHDVPGHLSPIYRTIPPARIVGQTYLYELRGPDIPADAGFLIDSVDGLAPREWWYMHDGEFVWSLPIEGADAYNSWDAVAVVTDR
jgi:hypothetical protein